ncbi:unnamed protein product [Ostreobium quekettii]|uniref:Uncharacterized protein n=1 Tax=Ostreobium quekettii TaxID=121088 RepID=A0A8S1J345_9CHLO|nr:unnamed protein product [Ostreobium quekettii]|eukprot:evm.model.scf_2189.2 EVM.evm.TU.scf_2189.2   scf_2189:8274-10175(-)
MALAGWRCLGVSGSGAALSRAMHTKVETMYVGAKLPILSSAPSETEADQQQQQQQQLKEGASTKMPPGRVDPLEGMPLVWLAEYLADRLMPALQNVTAAEKARQRRERTKPVQVFEPPTVPHFLPLTAWAAKAPEVRNTLVVDESNRQKARLSWYHPDDTMVPRNWFRGGLLQDIMYYRPFMPKKE